MAKRLMSYEQINAEKIPIGRSTIYVKMEKGEPRFPQPVVRGNGHRRALWDEADIDRYLEELKAQAAKTPTPRRSASKQPRGHTDAKGRFNKGRFAPQQRTGPQLVEC